MPHGWKLCLQAFHLSFLTCGCYGFLSLLGLALEEGQAVHSTKARGTSSINTGLLALSSVISNHLPGLRPRLLSPQKLTLVLALGLVPGSVCHCPASTGVCLSWDAHLASHRADLVALICFAEFYPTLLTFP